MLEQILIASCVLLVVLTFASFYRAVIGPTPADRIVAISVIGTKTVVIIAIMGFLFNEAAFWIDIALVYAIIGFLLTIGVARYIERGTIS